MQIQNTIENLIEIKKNSLKLDNFKAMLLEGH